MVLSSLNCPLEVRGEELGGEVRLSLPVERSLAWRYRCGTKSGVIGESTGGRITWVPPVELAEEYPEMQSIPVEVTVELLRGGRAVEQRKEWLLLRLPEKVVPQGTLTVADETGAEALCGSYLRGYSRAVVQVEAKGSAGAEIRECRITCGRLYGFGTRVCFDLPQIGLQTVTARVTDSRGRHLELTTTIRVAARIAPQGAILNVRPCDEAGNPDPAGAYLQVEAMGSVTKLPNLTPSFALRGKLAGAEKSWPIETEGRLDGVLVIPKVEDLKLVVSDGLESFAFPYGPKPLLDMDIPGRGLGIGCRGDRTGTVSLGLDVEMGENRLTGLPEAEQPKDALPLGQAAGRFLGPQLLWENGEPEAAFAPGEIPAAGRLFLIEGLAKPGGAHFWEVLGESGCLRATDGETLAARPVEKKPGALVFGAAKPENTWAIPLRIFRLLPGEEEQ